MRLQAFAFTIAFVWTGPEVVKGPITIAQYKFRELGIKLTYANKKTIGT